MRILGALSVRVCDEPVPQYLHGYYRLLCYNRIAAAWVGWGSKACPIGSAPLDRLSGCQEEMARE